MASDILRQLADHARQRVREDQRVVPPEEMREAARALGQGGGARFEAALRREGLSFICEIKRASPSKGLIAPSFPYLEIAGDYARAGADCISCLTEPKWFLGSDEIFRSVRQAVAVPMIRKDFTVDEYQIDQARVMGADAVLLICALLDTPTLARYLDRCEELGLSALAETHNAAEIDSALAAGARLIGVNNRNLKDFSVDFSNAARLRDRIPPECTFVAESGVRGPEDVRMLRRIGADAALIGEALMRAGDRPAFLRELREASRKEEDPV